MREQYNNGDEITLGSCNGCSPCSVNGVFCHEEGCPDAWRDYKVECYECGYEFYPTYKPWKGILCNDCIDERNSREM